jgi:prepilin-type N-terminal cleavage/methylation domain-containing protein
MRLRGFTLIELMMTVVILAVLAVVATASYTRYIRRARINEAVAVLGDVRIRQELYFQSNSRYACAADNCSCSEAAFWPQPDPTDPSQKLPVVPNTVDCANAGSNPQKAWCQLGLDPNGDFYFQFFFEGWDGSGALGKNDCSGVATCNGPGEADCFVLDPNKPWWFAVAHGNLDGDPHRQVSTFYISSSSKTVISFNEAD